MGNVNLIIKDAKGAMTGLSLETHTSFSKYAASLSREKTAEEVSKRIDAYAKYYGKKLQAFSEIPLGGNLFVFDAKTSSWLSMSGGKLVKIAEIVKAKAALTEAIIAKREAVSKVLGDTYQISGERLKAAMASLEASLSKS